MNTSTKCPKCEFTSNVSFNDCPKCGVIISKYLDTKMERKKFEGREASEKKSSLQNLAQTNALIIKQQKEWGEILTGFEAKNRYQVMDHSGNPLFQAEEESGSFSTKMMRIFLRALRPFTIDIFSPEGTGLFALKRPFRFFFHELQICSSNGALLGTIIRRFSILRRIYSVLDRHGMEIFQLYGPILHPWTFQIQKESKELGKITKKWSGLLKESFTDADTFGISFPKKSDLNQKAILLGAVFLIDFVHFEDNNRRN